MEAKKDFVDRYRHRAAQAARLLRHLPFVRLIGLNGSLVLGTATRESDIDLLIIAKFGRIYTVRFLTNLLMLAVGWRRRGRTIAGKLCLNRYQTTRSLEVKPHDAYHARYFSALVVLYDQGSVYQQYRAANRWMRRLDKPVDANQDLVGLPITGSSLWQRVSERLLCGVVGDWFESWLRHLQTRRIISDPRTACAPAGRVRYSDLELCFHPIKE